MQNLELWNKICDRFNAAQQSGRIEDATNALLHARDYITSVQIRDLCREFTNMCNASNNEGLLNFERWDDSIGGYVEVSYDYNNM